QVLMPSMIWRKRWTGMRGDFFAMLEARQSTIRSPSRMMLYQFSIASGPKRLCVRSEVAVERHAPVDNRVLFPARDTFRVVVLRQHDLLEDRAFLCLLLDDVVVKLKLLGQDRVRRLVELHVVLGLQLDVVLRVAIIGLP